MSSQGTTKAHHGAPNKGRNAPRGNPSGQSNSSSAGRNDKVSGILTQVEGLNLREIRELQEGLAKLGLSGILGSSKDRAPVLVPKMEPKPVKEEPPRALESKADTSVSKEVPAETGSGATRRTMLRKARKALKDASGNTEATKRALARLSLLASKYGVSLETVLPVGYESQPEESDDEEDDVPMKTEEHAPPQGAPSSHKGKGVPVTGSSSSKGGTLKK